MKKVLIFTLRETSVTEFLAALEGEWQVRSFFDDINFELQVMETSSRALGVEHPDTLTSMANSGDLEMEGARIEGEPEIEKKVARDGR